MMQETNLRTVTYFRAPDDDRVVAIYVRGDFDEFEKFPPFMDSEEEIAHVREAYKVSDPTLERTTKAHITDNAWPLQIIARSSRCNASRAGPRYPIITSRPKTCRRCRRGIRS
jgi:hypothetical protein